MSAHRKLGALAVVLVLAASSATAKTPPRHDLADAVAGDYGGDVTSDSQGSSKEGVGLSLRRAARNAVEITSDYPRLQTVVVRLTTATGKIVNRGGDTAFFYDPGKTPPHLDVSFHNEVSWSGERR